MSLNAVLRHQLRSCWHIGPSSITHRSISLPFMPFRYIHANNSLPIPPPFSTLESPAESSEARAWLSLFKSQSIPRTLVELTFSRSSGPGGQNVNKVNTKATLRCPVDSQWIPTWARKYLRASPFYVLSTNSLLITSIAHRSQSQNVDDCLSKLHKLILSASSASIKREPSEEQRARVRGFERAAQAKRRTEKDKRSQVKKGRSSKHTDW